MAIFNDKNGYNVYMGGLLLPITPSEITISNGSNNKTITLINEGDVNILKSPALTEISFEARFPMRNYPYSKTLANSSAISMSVFYPEIVGFNEETIMDTLNSAEYQNNNYYNLYMDYFAAWKEKKTPFSFTVYRSTPDGMPTWDTSLLVSLESFEQQESVDNGDDVIVSIELKQYKKYSAMQYIVVNPEDSSGTQTTTQTTSDNRVTKTAEQTTYTVKESDNLWNIAKKHYGTGTKMSAIYEANKEAIEADAKAHGKASSNNGHWIWEGLQLVLPSE